MIKRLFLKLFIAVGTYFIFIAGIAQAEDMPAFRPGMWEFNRTIENVGGPGNPQTMKANKCTNPAEDMKRQREMLSKLGCQVSSVTKTEKTYSFTANCKIQNTEVVSKSVMTVESDSAYKIQAESQSAGKSTKETLQAKRTGDCEKNK